ncbi:hypothetical protein GR212_27130 [Rhizobium lusitanum]|uniref:Uncharacterized protein n=1 Tax=Rhizobium lusitanum TaxID=293958 RepID=A0A6L9UH53_9HYPH|nr:hypothetical protein [Rhizobium lusitanum]
MSALPLYQSSSPGGAVELGYGHSLVYDGAAVAVVRSVGIFRFAVNADAAYRHGPRIEL